MLLAAVSEAVAAAAAVENEDVVLLHGLGRTRWSMHGIARALARDGYRVTNLSYPSRSVPLESLADTWLPAQLAAHGIAGSTRVHFVTHSMGGLIVRRWLATSAAGTRVGRVVMLAPPNAGSEVSERLRSFPPFRWFTGVNGARLGTARTDLPCQLGPWPATTADLGVIAGNRSLNPLFSSWLPGEDDGKVSVASTHLAGERDHRVVPYSHTWLGARTETLRHIRTFLAHGHFATETAARR